MNPINMNESHSKNHNENHSEKVKNIKKYHVVAGIIVHDERILCVKRGKTKFDYTSFKYEFPGGKIEENETEEEALIREIQEELKMAIQIKHKIMTVEHTYPDLFIKMEGYLCEVESKDLVLTEHIEKQWLKKADLLCLDWARADLPIVHRLMGL